MGKSKKKSSKRTQRKISVVDEESYLERRNVEGDEKSKKKAKSLKFFVDKKGDGSKKLKWSTRVLRHDALFQDADEERKRKKIPRDQRLALPEHVVTEEELQREQDRKKAEKAKRKAARNEALGMYDLWDTSANHGKPLDLEAKLKDGTEKNSWLQHVETVMPKATPTKLEDTSALPAVMPPSNSESYHPTEAALKKRVEKAQKEKKKEEIEKKVIEKKMDGARVGVLATQTQRMERFKHGVKRTLDDPTRPVESGFFVMPGRSDVGEEPPAAKKQRTEGEGEVEEKSELDRTADAMMKTIEEQHKKHVEYRRKVGKPRDTSAKGKKVLNAQLDNLDELVAETEKELQQKEERSKKRLAGRASRNAVESHRFGSHQFKVKKSSDVEAESRTSSGLRTIAESGTSLLQDRFDNYKRRNVILENSSKKVSKKRNIRYVERRSRRIPEGLSHEQIVDYISKL